MSAKRFIRRVLNIPKNESSEFIHGLPADIEFSTLDKICQEQTSEPLSSVSYRHLSAWKRSGAYKVFLNTQEGNVFSVIYKNSIYNEVEIPALKKLSIIPGQPEFLTYEFAKNTISPYLPKVYYCDEVIHGEHYQYILEDLSHRFHPARSYTDIIKATKAIAHIQGNLAGYLKELKIQKPIYYDLEFSKNLYNYTKLNLDRYIKETGVTGRAWDNRNNILDFYLKTRANADVSLVPVHGDYNTENILVDILKTPVKIIDWEWAGLGALHSDLATLLKRIDGPLEKICLLIFSKQYKEFSLAEHKYRYELCQIERGLLDAGFLALQELDSSFMDGSLNMSQYIEDSLQRALQGYEYCLSN
jgi:thiamine kinase-like enzyme